MRPSQLRSEEGVLSGCLDVFWARRNDWKKMQKQHVNQKKVKIGEKKSKIGKISSNRKNRVRQQKNGVNLDHMNSCT